MDGTLVDDARQIHDELWRSSTSSTLGHHLLPGERRSTTNLRQQFEDVAADLVFVPRTAPTSSPAAASSPRRPRLDDARRLVARVREVPDAGAVLCGKHSAYVERPEPAFVDQIALYYARLKVVPTCSRSRTTMC